MKCITASECSGLNLFEFFAGDDKLYEVNVCYEDLPLDITGWKASATLKLSYTDSDEEAELKVTVPSLTPPNSTVGVFYIYFSHTQTAKLYPGRYYFEVKVIRDDLYTTVVRGRVRVIGDVVWEEVS